MTHGFMGKVLWVDLGSGNITEEIIKEEVYEKFLSGSGLAAFLTWREMPGKAAALGPENILGFSAGILTGSGSLFSGRWMATGKSPLTGTWGESNCGGTLAPAIKRCGYDGIFFKGSSPQPVYLFLNEKKAEIRDAGHLWGSGTSETEKKLKETLEDHCCVACIGPAAEKLSLIAGISNDGGRMAARSGLGAVMGAKKLKALVLAGKGKITPADRRQMHKLSQKPYHWVKTRLPFLDGKTSKYLGTLMRIAPLWMSMDGLIYKTILKKWGTIGMNQISIEMGDSPIQNWAKNSSDFGFSVSDNLNPDHIIKSQRQRYHCAACPLGCGGEMKITNPAHHPHKIEFETITAFGSLLMNKDLESLLRINKLLNEAGMDSISAGGTVAFTIECYQNGLISKKDTQGLELSWGDPDSVITLLEMMIERRSIGDLLADGSKIAAQKIGKNALDFAIQAGGQELAMHDGRGDPGFALHASVDPSPGRHTTGSHLYYDMFYLWKKVKGLPKHRRFILKKHKYERLEENAAAAVACSRFTQILNGAGLCLFGAFLGVQRFPVFEWLNTATGWQKSPEEYMEIGGRIQTLKQLFNAREGLPLQHAVSKRALGIPPQTKGANRGRSVPIQKLVKLYWENSEWDPESGLPTGEYLKKIGLDRYYQKIPVPKEVQ